MKSNNNYEDYEDLTLPYDEEDKEHRISQASMTLH